MASLNPPRRTIHRILHLALVQKAGVAGDEEMQRFIPIEDLFKGRDFDRQIIVLCGLATRLMCTPDRQHRTRPSFN